MMDKDIQIGSYIRAYHAGIHQVEAIEPRVLTEAIKQYYPSLEIGHEFDPLVTYRKVLTKELKLVERRVERHQCAGDYCKKITRELLESERDQVVRDYDNAIELLFGGLE